MDDFAQVMEELKRLGVQVQDVGARLAADMGTPERADRLTQRLKQAKLSPGHTHRRPAPDGWAAAAVAVAEARAGDLTALAGRLRERHGLAGDPA